ncbi:MAG: DNA-binding response regulator [uncultured bacterium (gcode 4)]|uniref:DNA-binding response regulator n=1 Tax=uncultured bacterium (gcode 4) TaxID=1234023 RepID=K2G7H2_9BACT|nr:MAG: DNA-binding response regulator [uncultured bacterium (gcode 4)]
MNDSKILIVEDDKELATMYKIKFDKEWYIVKVADNWLTAITEVTEFEPNIILLDIMMPSMDWFETLRVIRELAPSLDCKIIMFSNLNSKDDIEKCMLLWADAYLLKANTTPKDAVEKIEELLWRKKQDDSNKGHTLVQKTCPHCGQTIHLDIEIHI